MEINLEQLAVSVKRFSNKNCGKNKKLERLTEPSEVKTALEHFQQKWTPVLRRKMRKNKKLERLTEPSEVKTALEQRDDSIESHSDLRQQQKYRRRLKIFVAFKLLRSFTQHQQTKRIDPNHDKVMFLPDIAYRNEVGEIVASLQAWVYRPKERQRFTHLLARLFGLDVKSLEAVSRQNFYARLRLFMAISSTACQLTVRDEQGRRHILPATHSNGQCHCLITLLPENRMRQEKPLTQSKIHFQLEEMNNVRVHSSSYECSDIPCFFSPPHGISIISDIDDTIKQSFIYDKKKLLRTTFLEKYRPVPEMRDWYQSLAQKENSAFHYVSSSPIQLYPALRDFMRTEHYPEGSIHLREATRWREVLPLPGSSKQHKSKVIARLLNSFKQRKFILIGDSAGDDALIYANFAKVYPEQIIAICIRSVLPHFDKHLYNKIFEATPPHRWLVSEHVSEMRQFIAGLEGLNVERQA